jgi:hypothetical protein
VSNRNNVTVEFPIFGILGLIFITLKLTGHITWSWIWVLSPFWGPFALALVIFLAVFLWAFLRKN